MRKIILIIFSILIAITLIGCGSTSGGTPASRTYIGALAKGDLVSFTMNPNGTFEFENSTISLSVTGKYSEEKEPNLNVYYYKTTELYINGIYNTTQDVYFKELPEIALVAYIPNGSGDSEVAVFTYQTTPILGSLNGEYHFLNVVTSNKSTTDVEIGKYLISGSGVIGTINSFANPLGAGTTFGPLTLSTNGYYIDVNPAGYKVSLTPAGVMIIDHGANNGMSVGNKVPPVSYGNDIIGTYFGITSGGENLVKVAITSSTNMDVYILDINTDTLHELTSCSITELSPGLYETTLGVESSTGDDFGVAKWTINSQGTFFGIKGDGKFSPGECQFNILGLKI